MTEFLKKAISWDEANSRDIRFDLNGLAGIQATRLIVLRPRKGARQPHVPSILVLMPYVQGAYGYGHVAIVESEDDNASPIVVHTSNMNWFNGGGGWDRESNYDFTVGSGVYFVWK